MNPFDFLLLLFVGAGLLLAGISIPLISGLMTTLAAIGLYFVPGLSIDGYTLAVMVFAVIPMVIGLWQSFRYLDTISR